MKGYKTQKWSAGDVIIVPAGVPHMIGFEVTVPNDILRVVVDPKKALKLVPNRDASIARLRAEGQAQGQGQAAAAPGRPAPPNMPGTLKNPKTQKFTAGGIIIVQAGVPHSVTYEVTEKTDIVRAVVDPKRSLELK